MADIKGKKILFLGAVDGMGYSARAARELGVNVVMTDYYESSFAKAYADKSYVVSTSDFDSLKQIVQDDKIDGIFTGFSDNNMRFACKLCAETGNPFYANEEQIKKTIDKRSFKELCNKFDIPIPHTYDPKEAVSGNIDIRFPVIVKPADSYSSKGISVCDDREELINAIEKAEKMSLTGEATVEDYLLGDEIMVHYVMADGNYKLTSIMNRYIEHEFSDKTSSIAPIVITNDTQHRDKILPLEEKFGRMMRSLGLKNAVGFYQGKANDDGVFFFEMALRFGGNASEIFNASLGQPDIIKEFLKYSVLGRMDNFVDGISNDFGKYCCNVTLFLKKDLKVSSIEEPDNLNKWPEVKDFQRHCSIGDISYDKDMGTYHNIAFRIVFVSESKNRVIDILENMKDFVHVLDAENNEMIDWDRSIGRLKTIKTYITD